MADDRVEERVVDSQRRQEGCDERQQHRCAVVRPCNAKERMGKDVVCIHNHTTRNTHIHIPTPVHTFTHTDNAEALKDLAHEGDAKKWEVV